MMYRTVNGLIAIPAPLYMTPNYTQNTRRHGCKLVFQLGASTPSITASSLQPSGFGTSCRLMSLCPLPSRHSSLDWQAAQRIRRQFRDICPVFICMFLSVWETWILSVAPSTSCTSAMHDTTQLWGICIIGKEEQEEDSQLGKLWIMHRDCLHRCTTHTLLL